MVHILLVIIYLAFISLGLPDSLLGSAWPVMHLEFGVPISWAGVVSMIIAAGTIVSSLFSDRLTRRLGAGRVTAISVGMTAVALFGFSVSRAYWMLLVWAIPYGLGAGSVDAALNKVGIAGQNAVKNGMPGTPPPNKPATIARKGSAVPLIDTSNLQGSITYVVE